MSENTIDFDNFIDQKWSKSTINTRRDQLKRLNLLFSTQQDKFYVDKFADYTEGLRRLRDFFDNPRKYIAECPVSTYMLATRVNYMDCLCIALKMKDTFSSESYVQYVKYLDYLRMEQDIERKKTRSEKFLGDFQESVESIVKYLEADIPTGVKILIKLLSLIDINDNVYGVLRINDLINTTIDPALSLEYSYLNLDTGQYNILGKCTKNRVSRTMMLPLEFTDYVKKLYSVYPRKCKWLLIKNKFRDKYETSSLYPAFNKATGISYYELRHQFVTYLQSNSTIEKINEIARNMGHSVKIAILRYNDIQCDGIEFDDLGED